MKKAPTRRKDPPKRSQATADLLGSLAELEAYTARGLTIEGVKREIGHRHPERVRVAYRAPEPGKYPPAAVRRLRDAMGMSQATFAEVLGVSRILVQSWERGVRVPSPLAARLLDTISVDPVAWLASLQSAKRPNRRSPSPARKAG
jgi:DNA-binding transcriptional regulator YiaG